MKEGAIKASSFSLAIAFIFKAQGFPALGFFCGLFFVAFIALLELFRKSETDKSVTFKSMQRSQNQQYEEHASSPKYINRLGAKSLCQKSEGNVKKVAKK